MTTLNNWAIIILAAGKGTRMGGDTPKPLVELNGKPLIQPIVDNSLSLGFAQVIVIISHFTERIRQRFPDERLTYIMTEPLGTGHAALEGLRHVATPYAIIAQADDSYFYQPETLRRLTEEHEQSQRDFTYGICRQYEPSRYSRVDYDSNGRFVAIRPESDDDNHLPKDIACGLYGATVSWICPRLEQVPLNSKGEIGLPSAVKIDAENSEIAVFRVPDGEWHGINTPEELARADRKLNARKS